MEELKKEYVKEKDSLMKLLQDSDMSNRLAVPIGRKSTGELVEADFEEDPYLIISGTTGTGKSSLLDIIITELMIKNHPDELKLILYDTHLVTMKVYESAPHLLLPVLTDPSKGLELVHWLISEVKRRLSILASYRVKSIEQYNLKAQNKLADIVCIIDDYTDIKESNAKLNEDFSELLRIGRIAGIKIILTTYSLRSTVISEKITTQICSRIAFQTVSTRESKLILGNSNNSRGAENLYRKGEFIYKKKGEKEGICGKALHIEEEISGVVAELSKFWGKFSDYETIAKRLPEEIDYDSYFVDAGRIVIDKNKASIGMLQRRLKIGFNRATRIMDQLSEVGVVASEAEGNSRKVLMTAREFDALIRNSSAFPKFFVVQPIPADLLGIKESRKEYPDENRNAEPDRKKQGLWKEIEPFVGLGLFIIIIIWFITLK